MLPQDPLDKIAKPAKCTTENCKFYGNEKCAGKCNRCFGSFTNQNVNKPNNDNTPWSNKKKIKIDNELISTHIKNVIFERNQISILDLILSVQSLSDEQNLTMESPENLQCRIKEIIKDYACIWDDVICLFPYVEEMKLIQTIKGFVLFSSTPLFGNLLSFLKKVFKNYQKLEDNYILYILEKNHMPLEPQKHPKRKKKEK